MTILDPKGLEGVYQPRNDIAGFSKAHSMHSSSILLFRPISFVFLSSIQE